MALETNLVSLAAVSKLIRVGNVEDAHQELVRLVKHRDAANHIPRFIDFALKLKKPDIIEPFLGHALPPPKKVAVLFGLVDLYQKIGDRKHAFRKLMDLADMCANSPEELRRVSAHSMRLGEFSFALDIRTRLLRNAPRDSLLALDLVESRIRVNKKLAHAELNEVMKRPDLPLATWRRASGLYDSIGELDAALRTIIKAVELGDSGFESRRRLATLLWRSGLTGRARAELAILLVDCRTEPRQLRILGDMALKLEDRLLAAKFSEAQYHCAPSDPDCILYLAHHLQIVGDRSRAQALLSSLFHAEQRRPHISAQQWVRLAEGLSAVGEIALAKEAVAEVVAKEPNGAVALKLVATAALLEKSRKSVSATVPRDSGWERGKLGFFSWLKRIFRY